MHKRAAAVLAYLERHAWLPRFLVNAASTLDRHFPGGGTYERELVTDAEVKRQELTVNIRPDIPVADALARLATFDDEWFVDQMETASGVVNFAVE